VDVEPNHTTARKLSPVVGGFFEVFSPYEIQYCFICRPDGCWDRTQDPNWCIGIWQSDALPAGLDLIHSRSFSKNNKEESLLQMGLAVSSSFEARSGAEIFKQSRGVRNRDGVGLSYRPARLHSWQNWFLGIDSWAP
jgi:hypothetical protein